MQGSYRLSSLNRTEKILTSTFEPTMFGMRVFECNCSTRGLLLPAGSVDCLELLMVIKSPARKKLQLGRCLCCLQIVNPWWFLFFSSKLMGFDINRFHRSGKIHSQHKDLYDYTVDKPLRSS